MSYDSPQWHQGAPHDTFDAYCRERWQLSRAHAYELIGASDVIGCLSAIADILPKNESVARPLTRLLKFDSEAIPVVWAECIDRAPEGKDGPVITAKHVDGIVREHTRTEPTVLAQDGCTVADLHELARQVQAGKRSPYGTIYADPPWAYSSQATRAATDNHYSTVSPEWLCDPKNMPVGDLLAEQAHLHLWTTNAFLFDAKSIIEAWGFEYKSCFVMRRTQRQAA